MAKRTLYGTVIVTYRCNARCNMCDCFKDPSKPSEEITLEEIKKLPQMAFTNITGGEPFVRQDIPDIVRELYRKSDRGIHKRLFYGQDHSSVQGISQGRHPDQYRGTSGDKRQDPGNSRRF